MLSLSGQPLMQSSSYVDSVSTQLLTRLPHLTSLNVTQCEGCGAADLAAHLAQQPHANLSSLQLTIDTDATHDQLATIVEVRLSSSAYAGLSNAFDSRLAC